MSESKKVYIAGKWTAKPEIKSQMGDVISKGNSITFNWTDFEKEGDGPEKMAQAGINDIEGVRSADVVVINMSDPEYAYRGTFCELGCALGLRKRIMLLCPSEEAICRQQPFFFHPSIEHYKTWDSLLDSI